MRADGTGPTQRETGSVGNLPTTLTEAPAGPAETRVQHVAEGVAEHVEAEHGQRDGQAWVDRHPRCLREERAPGTGEHGAPRRIRRRDTEAQEGERRLREDER